MLRELNSDEKEVLSYLALAWDAFMRLPEVHHSDRRGFMSAIHSVQNYVLSRPAHEQILKEETETALQGER